MSKYRVEYDNAMKAETYPEVISKRIAQNRVNELEQQKAELLKFIRKVYKEQWINNREFMDILKKYEVKE